MTDIALRPVPRSRFVPGPAVPLLEMLSTTTAWLVCLGASSVLGVVMGRSAILSTLHLVITLASVILVATFSRRPDAIVGVTVYAGMCDVLWRSTGAHGPYEGAKYAIIIGFAVLAIRFLKRPQNLGITVTIMVLLIPGAILGAFAMPVASIREELSSNLSGLVAVAVAVLTCSNLRMSLREMRGVYLLALSPVISLAANATVGTISSKALNFTDEVNFATSGGFGPNQVSSALCVGALFCILVMLQQGVGTHYRVLALLTGGWLVGQAVLTFSRGGIFGLVLAGAGIGFAAISASGQRTRVVVASGVLFVVALRLLSWAGAFTGGASEKRLKSTNSTNRTRIAAGDLRLFRSHPLEGVGVGRSQWLRDLPDPPHTEFTRLLAEHGFLGVAVLGLLASLCVRLIRTAKGWYRLATVGLLVIALAQMTHSATRIGSIAVCFGMAAFLADSE